MKIYDEYQVGKKLDSTDFPLAYLAQFEQTKASAKVTDNIKRWMCQYRNEKSDYSTFKNVPTTGFKIVKFVSRYSTSNKWFRVEDPRGFTIEISAENLVELLLNTTFIDGVIQGECVYYNKASLVSVGSGIYKDYYIDKNNLNNKKYTKPSEMVVGTSYTLLNKEEEWIYLGKFGYIVEAVYEQRFYRWNPNSEDIHHSEMLTSKKAAHFFARHEVYTNVKALMSPSKISVAVEQKSNEVFVAETIANIPEARHIGSFYVNKPYVKGGKYDTRYGQTIKKLTRV